MIFETSTLKEESLEELEQRKVLLIAEIQKLGSIKEELDATVINHEAQNAKYADLTKSIEDKTVVKNLLDKDISSRTVRILEQKQDEERLKVSIEEKTKLQEEITKLSGMVKVLQKEMNDFTTDYATKKQNAETVLNALKEKLNTHYVSIGSILAQLK